MENYVITSTPKITDSEFRLISNLIYKVFGIFLSKEKKTLVEGRLIKVIRDFKFTSFKQFYEQVVNDNTGMFLLLLIDKISTNHTYFFREKEHFVFLKNVLLPEILNHKKRENSKTLRIWCAGSSSGEECYTIAMIVREFFLAANLSHWDIKILGTDISTTALEIAKKGEYSSSKLNDIPIDYQQKYFKTSGKETVTVKDSLMQMIAFRRFNLNSDVFPFNSKFDFIFCRNVMIYFNKETRQKLIKNFYRFLYQEGHLFIGHSEAITREQNMFSYRKPGVYIRK